MGPPDRRCASLSVLRRKFNRGEKGVVLLSGEFHVDRTVTRRPPGRSRWRRAARPTEIVGLNTIWIVARRSEACSGIHCRIGSGV
jgi:hypothetical protein